MVVAFLTVERAAEATFEHLGRSNGELRGRLGLGHRGSSCKSEDEGKEEGDLGKIHGKLAWVSWDLCCELDCCLLLNVELAEEMEFDGLGGEPPFL